MGKNNFLGSKNLENSRKIRSRRRLSGKSGVECGAVRKGMANRSPFVLVFIAQRTHQCELPGKEDVTA
jgi:hypothetical protein